MWSRATNPGDWLPQSHLIKAIATACVLSTGGYEIHERVAQLFVVVHSLILIPLRRIFCFSFCTSHEIQNFCASDAVVATLVAM